METPNSSPAKKRARTDSNVHDSNEWKRHPNLYMSDGTVVLLANDTLFRVYFGLLSKHSEVFSGMASLSECQPPNAEVYDGCPLIHLTDDAEDLAYFLEMTLGLHHFHVDRPTAFSCAAAILQLSTKYMTSSLRQQAIDHFRRVIPEEFNDIGYEEIGKNVFGNDAPHPFALVSLFRECQLTQFLPWAFYNACMEGFDALVNSGVSQGDTIQMADEDTRIALRGWKKLYDKTLYIRRTAIISRSSECKSSTSCNSRLRMNWLNAALEDVENNPFKQWRPFNRLAYHKGVMNGEPTQKLQKPCSACTALWLSTEELGRGNVWDNLPEIFALPCWEELLQEEKDPQTGGNET